MAVEKEKNKSKVSAFSSETLIDAIYLLRKPHQISGTPFLLCRWSIFSSMHITAGFKNNFQDHRLLLEQFCIFSVTGGFLNAATSPLFTFL